MRSIRRVVAAIAMVAAAVLGGSLLVACGSGSSTATADQATSATLAATGMRSVGFGTPIELGSGLGVLVDAPRVEDSATVAGSRAIPPMLGLPVTVTNHNRAAVPTARAYLRVLINNRPMGASATAAGTPDPAASTPDPAAPAVLRAGQSTSFEQLYPLPEPGTTIVVEASDGPTAPAGSYRGTTPPTGAPASMTSPTPNNRAASGDSSRTPSRSATAGCGERAVARGVFDPTCSEYQGYLDPGKSAGRGASSGEIQRQYGCEKGYIPADQC